VPKNVIEFIVFTSLVTILIYLNNNGILIENLPVITFFLYSGYRSLPAFQQVYNSSALIRANYESVNQILKFDHLIENDDDLEPELKSDEISSIAVKGIDFRFGDQKVLFKDFSSIITGPALVAIVGKSGSGKSTLIDLLLKLNHPASGEILINGDKYTYGDARSLFAYVPQSIYLSDSTLLDNIYLGNIRLPIDYELVVKSVKLAGLESFVEGLPKGIHTKIGENGSLLSGGQRKRLGLARAFYSEKPVLILDEVTSGLDEVTEKDILNDLKLMSKSKLIILITHSSQNIALFDRVIDLNLYQNV
jgi:ABC-type multidrug transport system fused ATPase/permease subunit